MTTLIIYEKIKEDLQYINIIAAELDLELLILISSGASWDFFYYADQTNIKSVMSNLVKLHFTKSKIPLTYNISMVVIEYQKIIIYEQYLRAKKEFFGLNDREEAKLVAIVEHQN